MARIEIADGSLTVHIEGFDRFLALRSSLHIPLSHIQRVEARPDINMGLSSIKEEIRLAGAELPGSIRAGTFYHYGEGRYFYDVHHPERCIALDLVDERYKRIVIEIDGESPEAAAARIEQARGAG